MLTLSATPIPRTLQMALTGIRDLSIIATPPVDRLAVRTYVTPWDSVVIREALLREHYRGGQSFFVAPRIKDLPDLEEAAKILFPSLREPMGGGNSPVYYAREGAELEYEIEMTERLARVSGSNCFTWETGGMFMGCPHSFVPL